MLQEETDVTEAERQQIVDYLSRSFPKKVNVNRASPKEIEEALEISAKEAASVVAYRAKAPFKTLDDLKKVPGVDAAKIETNKLRVEY
jgi:competence protein ComEA